MATLVINRSDSRCGACGKSASPHALYHDRVYGYTPGEGCGEKFTKVSSDYTGQELEDTIRKMRSDLEFIDPLDFAYGGIE